MRKHDVRKWIHAVLDMLPLFIIPIFAIYMHRHQVTSYEVVYSETSTDVDITYKFKTNDVSSVSDLVVGNSYFLNGVTTPNSDTILFKCSYCSYYSGATGTDVKYSYTEYFNCDGITYRSSGAFRLWYFNSTGASSNVTIQNISRPIIFTYNGDAISNLLDLVSVTALTDDYIPVSDVDIDTNVVSVTYDDTDIGSQFVYALYLPIEKYFNFNNVATFNNMYTWLVNNFFNGSAPLVVPIVWNIILYEFIMDVLFLIYAVFMFIIDFVECLIDKAFGKSYRGGR